MNNVVVPVESVGPLTPGLIEVYGIEVEFFHNYFIGRENESMLVHNGTGCVNKPAAAEPAEGRVSGDALKLARQEFQAAKPAAWKLEAATNPSNYTSEQLARMRNGQAPIGSDGFPMEIHHNTPLAEGGSNTVDNFVFMTRSDHRLGTNYKLNHPNLP